MYLKVIYSTKHNKMYHLELIAVLLALASVSVTAMDLLDYIKPCARNSPDLHTCMMDNFKRIMPKLSNEGAPELQLGLFDPLLFPQASMEYDDVGFTGNFSATNSSCNGFKDVDLVGMWSSLNDSKNMRFELDVEFPRVFVEGTYLAEGTVANIPVEGRGFYNISTRNVKANWKLKGALIQKDGEEYLEIQHFRLNPSMEYLKLYVSNLFSGSRALDEALLNFMNTHWKAIYKKVLPSVERGWHKGMKDFANKVFLNIPFNKLFPPSS